MSPRAKKKVIEIKTNGEVEATARDYAMARVAAARASAAAVIDACDDFITLCIDPEDDDDASERQELLESALEHAGAAARALESAEVMIDKIDPEECEPWDADEESH
jgi:hypothetical protein